MKSLHRSFGVAALLLSVLWPACAQKSAPAKAEVTAWPTSIPCRVQDSGNPDLFLMTLGEVETPLAQ